MAEHGNTGTDDIKKALGSMTSGIGRRISEATERLYDTPIGDTWASVQRNAKNATRAVSEGLERMNRTYGYTNLDVWNLGDTQAEHIAKVMRRYAEETKGTDATLAEETARRATGIGSFANDLEMLYSISTSVNARGDTGMEEREKQRQTDFLADWDWFGKRFLSPEYKYDTPTATACKHADDSTLGNTLAGMLIAATKATNATASRITDGVGWIDMERLPEFETLRMASMLLAFADGNIGYPDRYRGSDDELLGDARDDAWDKHRISLHLAFSDGVRQGDYGDAKSRMELTNEQVGESFAAWEEDIYHVADVMETWGNWLSAYRHGSNGTMIMPDSPEVSALRAEFARCWHWIGKNATALWW